MFADMILGGPYLLQFWINIKMQEDSRCYFWEVIFLGFSIAITNSGPNLFKKKRKTYQENVIISNVLFSCLQALIN